MWEQQPDISSRDCWLSSAVRRREETREEAEEDRRSAWAETWCSTVLQPLPQRHGFNAGAEL